MKFSQELWFALGGVVGGISGAFYHALTPCTAGCSGGKMSLFIPVVIGAAAVGLLFQIIYLIRNPE